MASEEAQQIANRVGRDSAEATRLIDVADDEVLREVILLAPHMHGSSKAAGMVQRIKVELERRDAARQAKARQEAAASEIDALRDQTETNKDIARKAAVPAWAMVVIGVMGLVIMALGIVVTVLLAR